VAKRRISVVLGIRPDVVRASLVLRDLAANKHVDLRFIWSGQHYSENLKDIFFRELSVPMPDIELGVKGSNDAEIVAGVITSLYEVLQDVNPEAAVFLGDTNTVMGTIAAAQMNIPIVHIEGCMRSYDWRMPEEKYRIVSDHLSDVIYAYLDEYKQQGIAEGLNPDSIIVTTNPIVDVLQHYYLGKKSYYDEIARSTYFSDRGLTKNEFYLMTCHRRENVEIQSSFRNILDFISEVDRKIYFPASYRTQKAIKRYDYKIPENVIMVDPVGYTEMLTLMVNSRGAITDSGTVVEEACVLQIPSIQLRKSTERPQVYDVGASIKFDPTKAQNYDYSAIFEKFESLYGRTWENPLGDGKASERIVDDLLDRLFNNTFERHKPENYHLDISRSFREEDILNFKPPHFSPSS